MAEVAVVGAGVMGLATAHALTRAGRDVVVYEQFEVGHTRGSSHGRSRIFRLAYPDPKWVQFGIEAVEGWRALEAEVGEPLLVYSGLLELVRDPSLSSRAALDACGLESELFDRDEAKRRFGLSLDEDQCVLYQPEAGIVYADRACRAFARGVRIEEGHRVESLDDLREPVVVVTAGPWARALLARSEIDLPVVETCETVAYFRFEGEVPAVVVEIETRGHVFYSLADPLYGLKAGLHMAGRHMEPDDEQAPDEDTLRSITEWTATRFGLDGAEPVHAETCFYTNTDDERFILERRGRIVVGSACSGHGFKFAPAVGKRLAALASEALA